MHPSDDAIETACMRLEQMIIAARNSNSGGEAAVMRAAAAGALNRDLRGMVEHVEAMIRAGLISPACLDEPITTMGDLRATPLARRLSDAKVTLALAEGRPAPAAGRRAA